MDETSGDRSFLRQVLTRCERLLQERADDVKGILLGHLMHEIHENKARSPGAVHNSLRCSQLFSSGLGGGGGGNGSPNAVEELKILLIPVLPKWANPTISTPTTSTTFTHSPSTTFTHSPGQSRHWCWHLTFSCLALQSLC